MRFFAMACAQKDVVRLDVAVQNSVLVQRCERICHLESNRQRFLNGPYSPAR
jgi:hypothetical protein